MKFGSFDTDDQVFIVAEIGNNHEGDFTLAQEMIGRAAEAGADAVKFQTFVAEHYVAKEDSERFQRLQRFQFDYSQFQALSQQADDCGILFFSTPLDIASAHFLNSLQPIFKVSSADNNFFPLIDAIAEFNKPTIISTGLVNLAFLDLLHARWMEKSPFGALAFLHCVSSYPVDPDKANLGAISTLQARFPDVTVGYSDHTIGIDAAVFAVALGARIIEKHFTIDHHYSDFRDHELSADPAEMRTMVDRIRLAELLLGDGEKIPQQSEIELGLAVRRSIGVCRTVVAGEVLTADDLTWLRPGTGIPVGRESDVVGKALNRTLHSGEIIYPEMLTT